MRLFSAQTPTATRTDAGQRRIEGVVKGKVTGDAKRKILIVGQKAIKLSEPAPKGSYSRCAFTKKTVGQGEGRCRR